MRSLFQSCVVSLAGVLVVSSFAFAQSSPKPNFGGPEDLYEKLGDTGTGGPAPKRDLTGFWAGKVAAKLNPVPAMTPRGQQQFRLHKTNGEYPVADSNDPIKGCDPLGFPRNMLFMTRESYSPPCPARRSRCPSTTASGVKSGRTAGSFPKMWAADPPTHPILVGTDIQRDTGRATTRLWSIR